MTGWICSEGNGQSTGLVVGVGASRADKKTSGEVEAGTGFTNMSRRACLAEGCLETECLLYDITIVISMRIIILVLRAATLAPDAGLTNASCSPERPFGRLTALQNLLEFNNLNPHVYGINDNKNIPKLYWPK